MSATDYARILAKALGHDFTPRVKATFNLALQSHDGQTREAIEKSARVPYIAHPVGCALLVKQHYGSVSVVLDDLETVLCIALAHDLLEDTAVTPDELDAVCEPQVRRHVEALTKPHQPPGVTKDDHYQAFAAQILAAGPTAVFAKVCDSIDNLSHPEYTPHSLVRKLVLKATTHYLPLLERCPLGGPLEETYRNVVFQAASVSIQRQP